MTDWDVVLLLAGIFALAAGVVSAHGRGWLNAVAGIFAGVLLILVSLNVIH